MILTMISVRGFHRTSPALLLFFFSAAALESKAPNYWGCQDEVAQALPYCDPSLSIDNRLQDLLGRLTLEEKVAALSPNPHKDTCMVHTSNVSRVGLPDYMWLIETNTAVASACIAPNKCATEFAGPLSMAASFNRTSWYLKGSVFGTEQRAFMNIHWTRGYDKSESYIGLNAYGPNMNQPRDPRFGRTSELPGEDPYLSGQYATNMVRGMQEPDTSGRPKILAYLKHFTAYNRETNRMHENYNISIFDLFDTYLPQFEMALKQGKATGVMCMYSSVNGSPMCANNYLLNQVMREEWGLPNVHVTTDCGAVAALRGAPAFAPDDVTAAAWALTNGSDLEMGSTIWTLNLVEAVQRGLVTEDVVDRAFWRSYRPHFLAGRFDDPAASEWFQFGLDDIYSDHHQQIQLEAALQGLVLLKNKDNVLPLAIQSKIAVLGPLAHTRAGLMSDYENDESCFGGGHDCIATLAESIRAINGRATTTNASGVDVDSDRDDGIAEALMLAAEVDVIILCLGITKGQEREGLDRTDTRLPGLQNDFAQQVLQVGKPVILVLVNGGQVAIDELVDGPKAIVEAFNPNGIGGTALAMSLFGLENQWGKLPYTIYPYSAMESFDVADHNMSAPPGRTYRYFTGKAIFPFGFGLSLTSFEMSCYMVKADSLLFECSISNKGQVVGDEVIQVYHSVGDDIREIANHPVPFKALVDFARVRVQPGETEVVQFTFDKTTIWTLVNEHGKKVIYPGTHKLLFTNGVEPPDEYHTVIGSDGSPVSSIS